MKAVIMEDIPLDYGPWLSVSPECRHFLQRLLQRDPTQRATALEALEHPWFQRHFGGGSGAVPAEPDAKKGTPAQNNIVPVPGVGAPRCSFYNSAAASIVRSIRV